MNGDNILKIIEPHHYDRLEVNDFEGVLITKKQCIEIAIEVAKMRKVVNKSCVSSDVNCNEVSVCKCGIKKGTQPSICGRTDCDMPIYRYTDG